MIHKIMRKYIRYSLLIASITVLIWSCKDSFLDVKPQGQLSSELLANKAGVETQLVAAYSVLDGWFNQGGIAWGTAGSNWIWGSVTSDDAYKGSNLGDQPEILEIEMFDWKPTNVYFNNRFNALYEGVARSNSAIQLLAQAKDVSEDDKKRIRGEALVLRAHYHFDAFRMWGNVPYYTDTDNAVTTVKSNVETSALDKVIADLEEAATLLPVKQAEIGRVTQATAQAYLGKAYLYNKEYAKAKAQFDLVLANTNYKLMPCIQDLFNIGNDGTNTEGLLTYQASTNDGSGGGENANHPDRLANPHAGSPFGCCGFHQPSFNLVNAHKVDASGLPLFDTFNNSNLTATDAVDPRLDWTVGRDGIDYLDWGKHTGLWIRDADYSGPYSPKKFAPLKVNPQQQSGWQTTHLNAVNRYIIRLADVILMLAECEVQVGTLARATELVNMIRTRAGACAQSKVAAGTSIYQTTINDPSASANYEIGLYPTFPDKDYATKAIRMERRLELALEGGRFFDLKRWGIAKETINAYVAAERGKSTHFNGIKTDPFEDRHYFYPIPSQQIDLSKVNGVAALQQNAGY